MPMQAVPLGDGDAGVEQTVRAIRGLIDQGKKDPTVHERAAWIIQAYHVPAFDWRGEFRAIFDWVRKNIRFTRDPTGKEGLHAAPEILRLQIGDCDDFSILMCSLLGTIGARTRLVTISNHPDDPSQFSHIYPEVQLDGQWIPMDAGRRRPAFAKGPRNYFRKRVWDNDTGEFEDVQGFGGPPMRARRQLRGMGWATPYWRPGPGGRVNQARTGLRLGQDGTSFDWSQLTTELPSLITSATTGAANIIRAQSAPAVATAQSSALLNQQLLTAQSNPLASMSSTTWLLLGGAVLVAMMMAKEGR
jgi:hypothetical protein